MDSYVLSVFIYFMDNNVIMLICFSIFAGGAAQHNWANGTTDGNNLDSIVPLEILFCR